MLDDIPLHQPQKVSFHWEQEGRRNKRSFSLSKSLACYGGGKSKSESKNESTTTTTTTSNVEDNRQGVSEEGILAEEGSTVTVDRSVTNVVEDVSEEIAVAAIENSSGVAEVAVEQVSGVAESALDTSEALFREATGFASDTVSSQQEVVELSIRETQDSLRLAAQQQGELASSLLNKSENLIKDQNRESGERLGNTALIGAFALGGVLILTQVFKKS